jgi:pimeloyl-ACP methyl ester carboxylesterase
MPTSRSRHLAILLAAAAALGGAPAASRADSEDLEPPRHERRDLAFPCGEVQCAAWLYLPDAVERPPVVILAHGFAGTRDLWLPRYAELFTPTVIVTAEKDRIVSPKRHARALAVDLPAAELVIAPDTGHMPHRLRTDLVIAAIRRVNEMASQPAQS